MNGILLDTSIFIAYEHGQFDLSAFFQNWIDTPVGIAAITLSELWHGVERDAVPARQTKRAARVEAMLKDMEVFSFTADIARLHARLWAELETRGERIGAHDMQIAATCLFHEYAIATLNKKDFKRISGLNVF
jgi:predicted nucleic acid-binding protein